MTWWSERVAEKLAELREQQQRPLPPSRTSQEPQTADDTFTDLVAQARASMQQHRPALDVAERFGQAPGADIGTTARRPGAAAPQQQETLLDLSPQERALVVQMGTQGGAFGNERARDARQHAAEVQQLVGERTWNTVEDTTPERFGKTPIAGWTYRQI